MSNFSSSLFWVVDRKTKFRPHTLQSSCLESKGGDVDLRPDVSTCSQMEWQILFVDRVIDLLTDGMVDFA